MHLCLYESNDLSGDVYQSISNVADLYPSFIYENDEFIYNRSTFEAHAGIWTSPSYAGNLTCVQDGFAQPPQYPNSAASHNWNCH